MTTLARRLTDGLGAVVDRLGSVLDRLGLAERLRAGADRVGLEGRSLVALGTAALAVIAAGLYLATSVLGGVDPGSGVGYGFGVAAAVALLATMLYSVRRGLTRVRSLGPTRVYLQLHLWAGGLFALLVLFHTDFRLPAGTFTTLLWATAAWSVATGVAGIALQRSVPTLLRRATTFEVHLRRIPGLVDELRERAEAAVADAEPRVKRFYEREVAPELSAPRMVVFDLLGGSGTLASPGTVKTLRRTLSDEAAAVVDELREIRSAKREMDVHFTLQKVLRGWLYLHLPAAVLLLGLVALHVFFVTYF